MKRLEDISAIKDLDYSSKDCQVLIREFAELIGKMAQEYDALVIENQNLLRKLEQTNEYKYVKDQGNKPLLILAKKCITSIRLFGLKVTIKKIIKRIF